MSDNKLISKICDTLQKQIPAFQKGIASTCGVGKDIYVTINGKTIKAFSYNITSPGQVNVFYDNTNKKYIAWTEQINKVIHSNTLRLRKTRFSRIVEKLLYPFKVLTQDTTIFVQGFNKDVDTENIGNLIGLVNTGNDYLSISRDRNIFSFNDVNQTLINSMFSTGYIPYLFWVGGNFITSNVLYVNYNYTPYSYTSSTTGSFIETGLSESYNSWQDLIGISVPYSLSTRPYNFSSSGAGSITTHITWTIGEINNTHDYTYQVLYSSLPYYSRFINSTYYDNYGQEYVEINETGLHSFVKSVEKKTTANLEKTYDRTPLEDDFVNYTSTLSTGTVERNETLESFNLPYIKTSHEIKSQFTDSWSRTTETRTYLHKTKNITYRYVIEWNNSGTGNPKSTSVDLTWTYTESDSPSPSDWTIEFGEVYLPSNIGGNQYYRGYVWRYRTVNPDGEIGAYDVFDDPVQTVKRNLEYFDWLDQNGGINGDGWKPIENITPSYIYATSPSVTSSTKVDESFTWTDNSNLIKTYYVNDETRNINFNESSYDILISSLNKTFLIYWYKTYKDDEFENSYYEYSQLYNDVTTTIRPNTYISERNTYNPNTYVLGVKCNESFYELTDFDESTGFDFKNRFIAFNDGIFISQPMENTETFTCDFKIGLHENNRGNFVSVFKHNESNNQTNVNITTYHDLITFNPVNLNVDCYYFLNGEVIKYSGVVVNSSYTTSVNSNYYNESWHNFSTITINILSEETVDFVCWLNYHNSNYLIITPSDDYTRFLLEYLQIHGIKETNLYSYNSTFRIAIAKKITSDILGQKQDKWYADIYEFDTANKKFIRIGNESGALSKITGSEYDFISYYPTK